MSDNTFEREVLDRLIKIEAKLESWDRSKQQIYDNQRDILKLSEQSDRQEEDIREIKDRNKWLSRTTVGAVISAAVSMIAAALVAVFSVGGA